MPELPEVVTVMRALKKKVVGQTIKDIDVFYNPMMADEIKQKLIGQTILNMDNFGKYLIFHLSDYVLISHLRMEGKYYFKENLTYGKHDHIIFHLDDHKLIYNDVRKFGTFDLRTHENYLTIPPLKNLGKEPFDADVDEVYRLMKKRNVYVKTLLLDQTIMSGIGNIYANEILFLSKIHPMKKGVNLTKKDVKKLIDSSIKVLNDSIEKGGSSIHTFTANEVEGWYQLELLVHTKEGVPCKVCGNEIKREMLQGRSIYYCPVCQRR